MPRAPLHVAAQLLLCAAAASASSDADAACREATGTGEAAMPQCVELLPGRLWTAWAADRASGTIDFALGRAGEGWIAVGVGEGNSGAMAGADIAVVHSPKGAVVAEDRYGLGFFEPVVDATQHVELLSHDVAGGYTRARLRRPLRTCAEEDVAIRDDQPHMLIYALGASGEHRIMLHSVDARGQQQVVLAGTGVTAEDAGSIDGTLVARFDNFHIPTTPRFRRDGTMAQGTNQYKCLTVPLAELTPHRAPIDIVAARPVVGSKMLHHFVNAACRNDPRPNTSLPYGANPENDIYDCAMGAPEKADCTSLPGWAAGGRPSIYSATVDGGIGYRVRNGTEWLLFDTHFYNPQLKDVFDSSGFEFDFTTTLRKNPVGELSTGISPSMRLPAGQRRAYFGAHCPAESVAHLFGDRDEVTLLTAAHHLHQRGREARTFVVRDGQRHPLLLQPHFDYNFQGGMDLPFKLRRGDAIEVECVYDTSQDTEDVRWGEETTDEMCISVMKFYPAAIDRLNCITIDTSELSMASSMARTPRLSVLNGLPSHGTEPIQLVREVIPRIIAGEPIPGVEGQIVDMTGRKNPLKRENGTYDLPFGKAWAQDLDVGYAGGCVASCPGCGAGFPAPTPAPTRATSSPTGAGELREPVHTTSNPAGQLRVPTLITLAVAACTAICG